MIPLLAITIGIWNLQVTDGGFEAGGSPDQWEWAVPEAGPGGTTAAWGTRPDDSYYAESDDTLTLPPVPVSTDGVPALEPVLVLHHWFDIRSGDGGTVEWHDGDGWRTLAPVFGYPASSGYAGQSNGWIDASFHLTELGDPVSLRLRFRSNATLSADGWYLDRVSVFDGDVTAPWLEVLVAPEDTQELVAPYEVVVEAMDDHELQDVAVFYAVDGGTRYEAGSGGVSGDQYTFEIPAQPPDSTVRWYALADDGVQVTRWPAAGDAEFRVFLAAPRELQLADDRPVGTEVALQWAAPDSPHPVLGYRVRELGGAVVDVEHTWAEVPVEPGGTHMFAVSALYEAGEGDPSEVLDVEVEVPHLVSLAPRGGYQGDRVHLSVYGSSLYLLQGAASLDLGAGVEVEELEVADVNHARAVLDIDAAAPTGSRDLVVEGAQGAFTFSSEFYVWDGADRPRILSVVPASITQGEHLWIQVSASESFADVPAVDPGEGLVVTSKVLQSGAIARVEILADADAPAGPRSLVLDDGQRLWVASFEVEDWTVPPRRTCGHGGAWIAWLWLPLVLAIRRRS